MILESGEPHGEMRFWLEEELMRNSLLIPFPEQHPLVLGASHR